MKKFLKEIGLYLLVVIVLTNLVVNILQDRVNVERGRLLLETKYKLDVCGQRVLKNTCDIGVLQKQSLYTKRPDFDRLLNATVEVVALNSRGTGVCFRGDNDYLYILTAQHVVTNRYNNSVIIRTRDNAVYSGKVINEDQNVDLALIRLEKEANLTPVKLGDKEPEITDRTWIVGHPMGTYWTITEGIVSNTNVHTYLMTSATLTFGNSGGGVFNANGEIIGICSRIIGYHGGIPESNMGLAVRLSVIKEFLEVSK